MPLPEQDLFPESALPYSLARFLSQEVELGLWEVDCACVIRFANDAARRLLGESEGAVPGGTACRIFSRPEGFCSDCPAERVRRGSRGTAREIVPGGADGPVLKVQAYPDGDGDNGYFLVAEDISAYRCTERTLQEEVSEARRCRERLENILRSVEEGLVVADRQGRLLLLNPAAERFFGIRQTSLLRLTLNDCIRDRKLLKRFLKALEREGNSRFDVQGDGGAIWSVHVSPLQDGEGGSGDTVFLLRDITRERELDRMKSEFISTAAHELRTPLTAITGFSELILSDEAAPDCIREYATYIYRKAESLDRIISDLLDTSRIEAGRGIELNRESCDIIALIRETVLPYRRGNGRHTVEIDVPAGPVELRIDRGKMVQVLENLLSNAVKYSPRGGNIRTILRLLPGACQVMVEDQGIGMSQDEAARAFERFWRSDSSNTAVGGTGLGLSIAKYIVEAHGGCIWLESRKNKGTTVFFTVPFPPLEEGRLAGQEGTKPFDAPVSWVDSITRPEPFQGSAAPSAP